MPQVPWTRLFDGAVTTRRVTDWLFDRFTQWLTHDRPPSPSPLCDFDRLRFELRPCDVILIEGRSRISQVIKQTTQSPWSHAVLYIGRVFDIRDPRMRARVEAHFEGDPGEQLIIEALMGRGTIVAPLAKYRRDHLRICRPAGLSPVDAQAVIAYTIKSVGLPYDMRQLLDLARFLFPWSVLPRQWRSSLFEHNAGTPTRTVCSTLLASAFSSVDFPILPFIHHGEDGSVRFFKRNPRLCTPRDFDYSPYFEIIKYPVHGVTDIGLYRSLPWMTDEFIHGDEPLRAMPEPATKPAPGDPRIAEPDRRAVSAGRPE